MSRLDSHIRQKIAQRDCIDLAARWLDGTEGWIVEFGLGTGRSYSHLVERFPGRPVHCFDRRDVTHPRSRPPADRLHLGEFAEVLADASLHRRLAGRVILLHLDLGAGGPEDDCLPEFVVESVHGWLRPGAVVLSDQALTVAPHWQLAPIATDGDVAHADRYHVYRRR